MKERIQKLIARAGITSRRKAEALIEQGEVTVNGAVVTTPGAKADPARDHIKVRGKLINPRLSKAKKTYLLLNKPKGVLSSVSDPEGRKLVSDLIPKRFGRLFPVGRLDFSSEGLLILTNDGDLANLISSSRSVPKIYEVKTKGAPPDAAIRRISAGIVLRDGFRTAPARIALLRKTSRNAWFEVTLFEGHNQQIRKMFDIINFSVVKLRRTAVGHIRDEGLRPGQFRELTGDEIRRFTSHE